MKVWTLWELGAFFVTSIAKNKDRTDIAERDCQSHPNFVETNPVVFAKVGLEKFSRALLVFFIALLIIISLICISKVGRGIVVYTFILPVALKTLFNFFRIFF